MEKAPETKQNSQIEEDNTTPAADESNEVTKKPAESAFKKTKPNKRSNLHLEHVPSDEMDLLISTVNQANLGWKASTCKLQKSHKDYGKGQNCEDDDLLMISDEEIDASKKTAKSGPIHPQNMLAQVSNEQRVGMTLYEFGAQEDKLFKETLDKAQKWRKQYNNA